jgi:hypothetical protein
MRPRSAVVITALSALLAALACLAACSTTGTSSPQYVSTPSSKPCGPGTYATPACREWQYQNLGP